MGLGPPDGVLLSVLRQSALWVSSSPSQIFIHILVLNLAFAHQISRVLGKLMVPVCQMT